MATNSLLPMSNQVIASFVRLAMPEPSENSKVHRTLYARSTSWATLQYTTPWLFTPNSHVLLNVHWETAPSGESSTTSTLLPSTLAAFAILTFCGRPAASLVASRPAKLLFTTLEVSKLSMTTSPMHTPAVVVSHVVPARSSSKRRISADERKLLNRCFL